MFLYIIIAPFYYNYITKNNNVNINQSIIISPIIKNRLILKATRSVDGLGLKLNFLGGAFTRVKNQVDYVSLRKLTTDLQTGSMEIAQFSTRAERFEARLKTLNSATNAEANAILRLNSDFQQGLITEQGYKAGLNQISMSLQNAQIATEQLTIKTRVMQGVMKLTSGLANGIIGLISTLIFSKAVEGISNFITKNERLAESAKESINTINQQNESLESLKQKYIEVFDGELDETEKSKQLLEIKDKLINEYKIEEEQLKNINNERQKTIDLINEESRANRNTWLRENSKAIENAKKDIERDMSALQDIASLSFETTDSIDKSVLELMKVSNDTYGNKSLSVDTKNLIEFYDIYEKISGILTSEQQKRNLSNSEKMLLNRANDVVSTYAKVMENSREVYETYSLYNATNFFEDFLKIDGNSLDNITLDNVNQWKESLSNALDNSKLDEISKEEVQRLMKSALQEVNVSSEINISPTFTYDRNAVDNAVSEVENMFNSSSEDGSNKSNIFDKVEKFEKAIENIGKNGFIGRTDYEELLEIYPAIADVFEQTADGYTASLLDMTNSTRDFIDENSKIISDAQAVTFNQISDVNKQIAETDKKIFEARKGGYDNRYEVEQLYAVKNALIEQKNELEETTSKLKEYEMAMNFDEEKASIDATTESIGILNSSMKTLSGAFAEINENGTISVETLLTLIENGYATAIMYDRQTGAITLNRQVLEELDKARIQAMIDELELSKATSTHTAEIEAQIVALKNLQNNWSEIYSGTYSGSSSSTSTSTVTDTTDYYKENAEAQISALKHQYEIGNIEAIAYYNQLLDLTKYFYEGKSEYLDEYQKYEKEVYDGLAKAQKERLESEKDKITEANTEREKAIELIKAHNELMNAKENKTIRSYSEEKGWEYVQDKESILKSKQTLDKLISEYKANLIDDKIDEIQKMNFDALKEAVNKPIDIPTNTDIMKDVQRNIIENIQNNNNNDNSKNVVINIENINPNNFDDFMNELNEVLEQSILNIGIGL